MPRAMKNIFLPLTFSILFAAGLAQGETLDLQKLLSDYSSLDFLYQPLPFRTYMISTYDRTGGNQDQDNFLEKSATKALLADLQGPGVITRIFCALPKGTLKIYLDRQSEPLVSAPASEFFSGKLAPFSVPLVGNDPAGFSYFPVPFSKNARLEIESQPGDTSPERFGYFWQVEWFELSGDYQVKSLTLPLSGPEKAALENLKASLAKLERFEVEPGLKHFGFEQNILPGEKIKLAELAGPAVIRKIQLELIPDKKAGREKILFARIFCSWEGEDKPSVIVGAGSFFGNAFNQLSPKILVRRTGNGGESLIPMPFSQSAKIEIENPSNFSGKAGLQVWLEPGLGAQSPLRFHALEREEKVKAGAGLNLDHKNDYQVLDASGQGRYLGTSLLVFNRYIVWWGEGEESFQIDGKFNWVGTGSEDYFDGSYMNFGKNLFASSLIENSYGKGYSGLTLAYKFHILDPVYFQNHIRLGFEHGLAANDLDNWYRSVAYWYQTEPHQDFSAMAVDKLDLRQRTTAREIDREVWRAMPLKDKIILLILWVVSIVLFLLLVFFVIITVAYARARKRRFKD